MSSADAGVRWDDEWTLVTANGIRFLTEGIEGNFARSLVRMMGEESTPERFVIVKSREDIDRYLTLFGDLRPERIVELGVYRGGGTAFLMEVADPTMLVAVEYEPQPVAALESYLDKRRGDRCQVHYGVNQADGPTLRRIVDSAMGTEQLDLVIDDASHLGPETRASFETLFPLLRPGGVYIIEDWSWHLQDLELPGASMEMLIRDLVTAAGRGPGLIAGIDLAWDVLTLRRGYAPVDAGAFVLDEWFERMV